jgi:hypothetical protein
MSCAAPQHDNARRAAEIAAQLSDRGHFGTLCRGAAGVTSNLEVIMLWTIALVLLVLWFLGLVSSYTMGGFIHILLVLAIIAVLVRVIQGRRVV